MIGNSSSLNITDEFESRFQLQAEHLGEDKLVNKMIPIVSICIITYQHGRFVRDSIESALSQQTDFPYEIVLGEDDSTDGTREICIEYAEKHPDKIRLFLRDRSLSVIQLGDRTLYFNGTFTRKSARGKYVAILEGDDYWIDNHKLQKQVEFLEAHADYSACFTACEVLNEMEGGVRENWLYSRIQNKEELSADDVLNYAGQTMTWMFRKDVVHPIPAFLYELPFGDIGLFMMAFDKGKIKFLPDITSVYRIHGGGLWSGKTRAGQIRMHIEACKMIDQGFDRKYHKYFSRMIIEQHYSMINCCISENRLREARKQLGIALLYSPIDYLLGRNHYRQLLRLIVPFAEVSHRLKRYITTNI